jgi:hypothetical protein
LSGITIKSHENLSSGLEEICRSFIPEASYAFRLLLPYSKQLALVAMVTSLPLYRFRPTGNYMLWLPLLHKLKTECDVTMVTQECKRSQTFAEQR